MPSYMIIGGRGGKRGNLDDDDDDDDDDERGNTVVRNWLKQVECWLTGNTQAGDGEVGQDSHDADQIS